MSTVSNPVTPPPTAKTTLNWADRLRNLATLMVIGIHTAGPISQQTISWDSTWWTANWIDAACRVSVPLFVLLSGGMLLSKDYATGPFLNRRLTRVAIPALVWMIVYNFYNLKYTGEPNTIKEGFLRIVENKVHYHLWFIYLIIGLYFMYPILRPWIRQARDRDYWYLFILCALASWGYKIIYTFTGVSIGMYWETFTNNVGYFVLGHYLTQKPLRDDAQPGDLIAPWPWSRKTMIRISVALIVIGSTITAWGSYFCGTYLNNGRFHPYFFDYLTPNVGMAVIGWFLLAKLTWNAPLTDLEREFSNAGFGIYLIHVIMLDAWAFQGYWFGADHPAVSVPIVVLLTAFSSLLVVKALRALPLGDRIT